MLLVAEEDELPYPIAACLIRIAAIFSALNFS